MSIGHEKTIVKLRDNNPLRSINCSWQRSGSYFLYKYKRLNSTILGSQKNEEIGEIRIYINIICLLANWRTNLVENIWLGTGSFGSIQPNNENELIIDKREQ